VSPSKRAQSGGVPTEHSRVEIPFEPAQTPPQYDSGRSRGGETPPRARGRWTCPIGSSKAETGFWGGGGKTKPFSRGNHTAKRRARSPVVRHLVNRQTSGGRKRNLAKQCLMKCFGENRTSREEKAKEEKPKGSKEEGVTVLKVLPHWGKSNEKGGLLAGGVDHNPAVQDHEKNITKVQGCGREDQAGYQTRLHYQDKWTVPSAPVRLNEAGKRNKGKGRQKRGKRSAGCEVCWKTRCWFGQKVPFKGGGSFWSKSSNLQKGYQGPKKKGV